MKKKNKWLSEYRKERKRINQFLNRAMERGYIFPERLFHEHKNINKQAVESLKKLTTKELYKKAQYSGWYVPEGKAVVSGEEGRKLERKAVAQKAKETRERKKHDTELPPQDDMFARTVVQHYINRIEQAPTIIRKGELEGGAKKLLLSWINQMIKENGYWGTSEMILKGEESGTLLTFKVLNYFDIAVQYIGMMVVYLPEYGVQYGEEVLDRLDYIKAVAEKFEDMEDWNNAWG